GDRFRGHVSFQRAALVNGDSTCGNDLSRHPAFDVDVSHADTPETLNLGLFLDHDVLRADPAGNFTDQVERHRIFAFEIAPKFSLNYGGITNHARAAEIALVG